MVFCLHFGWLLHHFSILFRSRNLIDFWMAFLMDFYQKWSQNGVKKWRPGGPFSDTFPQGVLCRSPWLVLAPFWLHFGRFWLPFGSILDHFGSIIEHVGSIFYQKPSLSAPEYAEHLQITADTSIEGIFSSLGHMRNFAAGNFDPHVAVGTQACLGAFSGSLSWLHSTLHSIFAFLLFALLLSIFSDSFPAQLVLFFFR